MRMCNRMARFLSHRFSVVSVGLGVCLSIAASASGAVLTGNLVQGGDFEDLGYLKNATAPDGVPPHKFSQTYDLGMWLGHWGPTSNPGGLGGFSTFDDPRDLAETGGDTMATGLQGNMNRSVDHTNPGNHFMEITMFYPRFVQWIEAPADHVAGPIRFSYDLLQDDGWTTNNPGGGGAPWGRVYVFGMNTMPIQEGNVFSGPAPGAPGVIQVLDENVNPDDGDMIFYNTFGDWMDGSYEEGDPDGPFEYFGVWQHYDTAEYIDEGNGPREPDGTADYQWWGSRLVTQEVTQAYPYYAVMVAPFLYEEGDTYFWLYGGKVVDGFTFAFDNFNLQLSVADPDVPPAIAALNRGDFRLDGGVDTEDINPFILALTDLDDWKNTFALPFLVKLLLDGDIEWPEPGPIPQIEFPIIGPSPWESWAIQMTDLIIDEIDPMANHQFNTEDINPFITILTGGGQSAVIPEPATFGLLALGGLAVARRRR